MTLWFSIYIYILSQFQPNLCPDQQRLCASHVDSHRYCKAAAIWCDCRPPYSPAAASRGTATLEKLASRDLDGYDDWSLFTSYIDESFLLKRVLSSVSFYFFPPFFPFLFHCYPIIIINWHLCHIFKGWLDWLGHNRVCGEHKRFARTISVRCQPCCALSMHKVLPSWRLSRNMTRT